MTLTVNIYELSSGARCQMRLSRFRRPAAWGARSPVNELHEIGERGLEPFELLRRCPFEPLAQPLPCSGVALADGRLARFRQRQLQMTPLRRVDVPREVARGDQPGHQL